MSTQVQSGKGTSLRPFDIAQGYGLAGIGTKQKEIRRVWDNGVHPTGGEVGDQSFVIFIILCAFATLCLCALAVTIYEIRN